MNKFPIVLVLDTDGNSNVTVDFITRIIAKCRRDGFKGQGALAPGIAPTVDLPPNCFNFISR